MSEHQEILRALARIENGMLLDRTLPPQFRQIFRSQVQWRFDLTPIVLAPSTSYGWTLEVRTHEGGLSLSFYDRQGIRVWTMELPYGETS